MDSRLHPYALRRKLVPYEGCARTAMESRNIEDLLEGATGAERDLRVKALLLLAFQRFSLNETASDITFARAQYEVPAFDQLYIEIQHVHAFFATGGTVAKFDQPDVDNLIDNPPDMDTLVGGSLGIGRSAYVSIPEGAIQVVDHEIQTHDAVGFYLLEFEDALQFLLISDDYRQFLTCDKKASLLQSCLMHGLDHVAVLRTLLFIARALKKKK